MRFVSAPLVAAAAFIGIHATAKASVRIHIDLHAQRMHVSSREGDFDWPVSTGKRNHRTPTGVFHPQRMYTMVHSAKYNNAPMPHSIFFTGGYAIHGTGALGSLGQPASHGCVRLAPGDAAALYSMVKREGATIVVSGSTESAARVRPHRAEKNEVASVGADEPVERPDVSAGNADFGAPSTGVDEDSPDPAQARETHRAGHRLAAHWRRRYRESSVGFAEMRRSHGRSLREWADNPLENQ